MAEPLPQRAKDLIDAHAFVVLGTGNDNDGPHTAILWATLDEDTVLMSTVRGLRKERNLMADPRASVLILDPDSAYRYVELRGTVEVTEEGGPELIQRLSRAYTGQPSTIDDGTGNVRVVLTLNLEHSVEHGY
jgi:PPOX class probable F420-dependent enzyme